jgi:hypothetical protein
LFNILERSRNYLIEDDNPLPPKTLGARVLSYVLREFKAYIERVIV